MNQPHRVIERIQALMRAQNDLVETLLHDLGDPPDHPHLHTDDQLELPFEEPPPF